jgi:hypothetical protein
MPTNEQADEIYQQAFAALHSVVIDPAATLEQQALAREKRDLLTLEYIGHAIGNIEERTREFGKFRGEMNAVIAAFGSSSTIAGIRRLKEIVDAASELIVAAPAPAAPAKKAAKKVAKKAKKKPAKQPAHAPRRRVLKGEPKLSGGQTRRVPRKQEPRWILTKVLDLSAEDPKKPTPAFHAGAKHEIQVIIGAEQQDWLAARGVDASQSIDSMLPKGTHELTVAFFLPASGTQTGKLTLPPRGPTPKPAKFRFDVGPAGSRIEALISIVYRGRVLQTALLTGLAAADPLTASKAEQIARIRGARSARGL